MKKKRKKKKKKTNVDAITQVNTAPLCNTLSEREHILVELQKRHKMTNSVLPWIPIVVKPPCQVCRQWT